jgi:hypothetical protein
MSVLLNETLISFADVPKHLPKRVCQATLHRWRQRGLHGVKLETLIIAGQRHTSTEALGRFFTATSAAADAECIDVEDSSKTRKNAEKAGRELEKAGI